MESNLFICQKKKKKKTGEKFLKKKKKKKKIPKKIKKVSIFSYFPCFLTFLQPKKFYTNVMFCFLTKKTKSKSHIFLKIF